MNTKMFAKKRIGIDARLINQTGVGTYIKNLVNSIDLNQYQVYLLLRSEDKNQITIPKNFIPIITDFRWHSFSEQFSYLRLLNSLNLDLVHFTYFSYPILYRKPFIITIHDLIPIKFPTGKASTLPFLFYWLKNLIAKVVFLLGVRNSQFVITPSESVKAQVKKLVGDDRKIVVTYEGIDWELLNIEREKNKKSYQNPPKPYWLYVGNFYPHKNIPRLLEAYGALDEAPILVLKGPQDAFVNEIKSLVGKLGLNKKVIFLHDRLTGVEMRDLIKDASLLIQPSLEEGFGLPPLEASFLKVPVVVSKLPIFDEILGKNYLSFDPYSVISIRQALIKALKNQIKHIVIDTKIYSFDKMALETKNIYVQALKKLKLCQKR